VIVPTLPELVRFELAHGSADYALERALAAALEAGRKVLSDYRHRPPAEKLAMALQAADEVLEELAVELAGDLGPPTRPEG
jgi:hypothetical protein